MKKFRTWTLILTKRTLKSPLLIILLITMPLLTFIVTKLPSFNNELSYKGGLYVMGEDELAEDIKDELIADNSIFEFVEYTDLDEMYEDIHRGELTCGYIFPEDLSERSSMKDCKECITVIKKPEETLHLALNEMVYSKLIKLQNFDILPSYVQSLDVFEETDTEAMDRLLELYDEYADSDMTLHLIFKTYGASGLVENNSTQKALTFPIRGILGIMVFLAGLFGCVTYMSDREKGIFATISNGYKLLCQFLYVAIPAVLFGASALLTLALSGSFTNFGIELLSMLMLVGLTIAFGQLLIIVTRNSKICIAAIPGIIVGCLIFCPVFITASNYLPAAKVVEKLFVPYYYLNIFM